MSKIIYVVAFLIALSLPKMVDGYMLFQLSGALAFSVACLGLNTMTGFSGQVSLAHNAFFALGAYTAALAYNLLGVGHMGSVIIAALTAGVAGVIIGIPAQRIRGLYLAMVTLAIAYTVTPVIKQFSTYTGGVLGLRIQKPEAPVWLPISQDVWIYYVILAVTVLVFCITSNVLSGDLRRSLIAIRDGELAAQSLGINNKGVRVFAFGYGCALAGVGGALLNMSLGFIAPDSFMLLLSIQFLAACVFGGAATIGGALVAGFFMQLVPPLASDVSLSFSGAIFGGILILGMMVLPKGVIGSLKSFMEKSSIAKNNSLPFRKSG